jgi:hypothetical protein
VATLDVGGITVRDRVGVPALVAALVGELLALPGADPALFARITLSPKRVGIVHGTCRYPRPANGKGPGRELRHQGYVLTAAVRTDPEAYPCGLGHWGAVRAPRTRQGWRSGPVVYEFGAMPPAAGFVLAHELAHVALRQKWVHVKNTEAVTNALALHWCARAGLRVQVRTTRRRDRLVPPAQVLGLERPRQLRLW